MGWYSAKILFETSITAAKDDEPLVEESIRVVEAKDEVIARRRAKEIALAAEHEYLNEEGESVRWVFKEILEVQEICGDFIEDGTEVFSVMRFKRSAG